MSSNDPRDLGRHGDDQPVEPMVIVTPDLTTVIVVTQPSVRERARATAGAVRRMLAATFTPEMVDRTFWRRNRGVETRGPMISRRKRGSGRGGASTTLRKQLKIKRITGTLVGRPRHASSTLGVTHH